MHQHFFRTYQQAREHFIKACCDLKGELASIKHPEQGRLTGLNEGQLPPLKGGA